MNLFVIFYVLWMSIATSSSAIYENNEEPSYDPIPLLYYPDQNIYTISSIELLNKMIPESETQNLEFSNDEMIFESGRRELEFAKILFICDESTPHDYHFKIKEIIASINYRSMENNLTRCHHEPLLHIFKEAKVEGLETKAVGYRIQYLKKTLQDNLLPIEPLHIAAQGYGVAVFYFSTSLRSSFGYYSALHHFRRSNSDFNLISSLTCDEYKFHVGDSYGNSIDFGDLLKYFMPEYQDEWFRNFEIPLDNEKAYKNSDLKNYLIPHRMVPTNDFIGDNERKATCVAENHVPIWEKISEILIHNVEEFLQKLAHVLDDHTLTIRTLALGQLEWKRKDSTTDLVFLDDSNKKILVPKYFLKIIEYTPFIPTNTIIDPNDHSKYSMIIVIHNELFDHSPRLCNEKNFPICEKYGWNINLDTEWSYCCKVSDLSKYVFQKYKIQIRNIFDLHKVVAYDKINKHRYERDITQSLSAGFDWQNRSMDDIDDMDEVYEEPNLDSDLWNDSNVSALSNILSNPKKRVRFDADSNNVQRNMVRTR